MNSQMDRDVKRSCEQRDIWLSQFVERHSGFCDIRASRISVLSGWTQILDQLFDEIGAEFLKARESDPEASISVLQIKQKFGGLRVYLGYRIDQPFADRINTLIESAQEKASRTCEICGAAGNKESYNGWFVTMCDRHATGAN